jgi:hypothetical protein
MTKNKNYPRDNNIISEYTPVRIGLVIAFLGAFGTAIYWGASVNSKLDSILSAQAVTTATTADLQTKYVALDKELSDLKLQNAIFEVSIKTLQDKAAVAPAK